jgi:hypothetical protein
MNLAAIAPCDSGRLCSPLKEEHQRDEHAFEFPTSSSTRSLFSLGHIDDNVGLLPL